MIWKGRNIAWKGYKRVGKCNKCGMCCYLALGMLFKGKRLDKLIPFQNYKNGNMSVCKAYNPQTRLCEIDRRKKFYRDNCRDFPQNPSVLKKLNKLLKRFGLPKCSYKFKRPKSHKS